MALFDFNDLLSLSNPLSIVITIIDAPGLFST